MNKDLKIKAVLVDDSDQARKLLRLMLKELADDFAIVGEANDVDSAVVVIKKEKPDVVFLDIEMPNKSGLQLIKEFPKEELKFEVIFTTAYNHYAIQAFRLSAIDYLLKPIQERELSEAVDRIRKQMQHRLNDNRLNILLSNINKTNESTICIPVLNGYDYLKLEEIIYLEASGSYTLIYLTDGKTKTISKNLKYFEQLVNGHNRFIRVHRSSIINLDFMKSFSRTGRGKICMSNGSEIDLARDRRHDFFTAAGIA